MLKFTCVRTKGQATRPDFTDFQNSQPYEVVKVQNFKPKSLSGSAQLAAGVSQHVTGYNHAVDLSGAFVDISYLGISKPLLQQVFPA